MSDKALFAVMILPLVLLATITLLALIALSDGRDVSPATCNELCGLGRVELYRFNTESKHYECFCRKD